MFNPDYYNMGLAAIFDILSISISYKKKICLKFVFQMWPAQPKLVYSFFILRFSKDIDNFVTGYRTTPEQWFVPTFTYI